MTDPTAPRATLQDLYAWGRRLSSNDDWMGLAERLLRYANAWKAEVKELRDEIEWLRCERAIEPDEKAINTNWRKMREQELRYIETVLHNIRKQDGEGARESADDTIPWLRNRLTVQSEPIPSRSDCDANLSHSTARPEAREDGGL